MKNKQTRKSISKEFAHRINNVNKITIYKGKENQQKKQRETFPFGS